MSRKLFSNLPSVSELMDHPRLKQLTSTVSNNTVVTGVSSYLNTLRIKARRAAADIPVPRPGDLIEKITQWIITSPEPTLRPIVNATGAILHPTLGDAPLAAEAIDAAATVAAGYSTMQYNIETGSAAPGARLVTSLLESFTDAESAMVLDSQAGATLLTLTALAPEGEVIVSRGHLLEIDDSFRVPEVLQSAPCSVVEVGTINKTRIEDYANATTPETSMIIYVLPDDTVSANSEHASLEEVASLGSKNNIPVVVLLASGSLVDLSPCGLEEVPIIADVVRQGVDLVIFSGGRLIGGPSSGIVVGKSQQVEKLQGHTLESALRINQLVLATLAGTLQLYTDTDVAERSIPALALASVPVENLRLRAERLGAQLVEGTVVATATAVATPGSSESSLASLGCLPSWCVAISPEGCDVAWLAEELRTCDTPVASRVSEEGETLLLDLRSVSPREDALLVDAIFSLGQPVEETAEQAEDSAPDLEDGLSTESCDE